MQPARRFAVIGTGPQPTYGFASVFATVLWREVLGWETIVFAAPGMLDAVRQALGRAGAWVRASGRARWRWGVILWI